MPEQSLNGTDAVALPLTKITLNYQLARFVTALPPELASRRRLCPLTTSPLTIN
jgi:hypothetical protein